MPHAWILDVLSDLRTYAEGNNLPAIALAAAQSFEVAQTEIAAQQSADQDIAVD